VLNFLLELGAGLTVVIAGVGLWALPRDTPVIGRPPVLFGGLLVVLGALIVGMSLASRLGVHAPRELKRADSKRPSGQRVTKAAGDKNTESVVTVRPLADLTAEDLIKIERDGELTTTEKNRLLEPYIGQRLKAEGQVDNVWGTAESPVVGVSIIERDHFVDAHFMADKARASLLRKGVAVRIRGELESVADYGITLRECSFE
jgi:hypothetical protein